MASIPKLPSGAYRLQNRRKGRSAGETFLRRDDAQKWARQAETLVDPGLPLGPIVRGSPAQFR